MPLNWRRGFNRVFVLAAVGWAIYVLFVYPMQKRGEAFEYYTKGLTLCAEDSIQLNAPGKYQECARHEEEKWRATVAAYPFPLIWQHDWLSRLFVFGVLMVPPAAAYGLLRLAWTILAWVKRGFQQASG